MISSNHQKFNASIGVNSFVASSIHCELKYYALLETQSLATFLKVNLNGVACSIFSTI